MDGKISEIIDNVIDTDDYFKNKNKQENINSINSWNKLTYLDKELLDKKNNIEDDISLIENQKEKTNQINNNSINTINEKSEKKILNENLFKGKGFRTNIDFFWKSNSEILSLSGITDVSSLAEYPNIFSCVQPRPGTNRYRGIKKPNNNHFNNSFYNSNTNNNNIINNTNLSTNSFNRKNLPKIKNQIEEKKLPINRVVISAKNK